MTKKDYIIIANAIRPAIGSNGNEEHIDLKAFLHNFCLSAKQDNKNFDAEKFKYYILGN